MTIQHKESDVEFASKVEFFFWSLFKFFFNSIIRVCCDENVINIADLYLGFCYYCFKYFVFWCGYVEFGNVRNQWLSHRNTIIIYIYIYICCWRDRWTDFGGTGKGGVEDFWLYSWWRNWEGDCRNFLLLFLWFHISCRGRSEGSFFNSFYTEM